MNIINLIFILICIILFLIVVLIFLNTFYFGRINKKIDIKLTAKIKAFDSSPNPIVCLHSDFTVITLNNAALELFQTTRKEIKETPIERYFAVPSKIREDLISCVDKCVESEHVVIPRKGEDVPIKVSIVTFVTDEGERQYAMIMKDIRQKISKEREVQLYKYILEEGEKLSEVGAWLWDLVTMEVIVTKNAKKIWRMEDFPKITYDNFRKRIYYKDSDKVASQLTNLLKEKEPCEIDFRLVTSDGKVLNFHNKVKPILDEDKEVKQLIGISKILK